MGVRRLFRWFRRLIYLLVVAAFVYLIVTSAQVVASSRTSHAPSAMPPANAIVVIGSATPKKGISADLKARCEQAAALFAANKARIVIATGGPAAAGDPSEASIAATYLRRHGVHTVVEVDEPTVPAQLAKVERVISGHPGRIVILVADPLQTKWLRGVAIAEKLIPEVSPGPAPKGSFWGMSVSSGASPSPWHWAGSSDTSTRAGSAADRAPLGRRRRTSG